MKGKAGFISPIRLTGPVFNCCEFRADQTGSAGGVLVDVSIKVPDDAALSHEGGAYVLHHSMDIGIKVREDCDGKADGKEMMRVLVSMMGEVSVSDDVDASEEDILQGLRINAISLFYSSARSYIEMVTGMSSIGRFSIPPIDPKAYLSSID